MVNLKWLWQFVRNSKWSYLFYLTIIVISAGLSIVITGIQKFIIDDVIIEQQYSLIWKYLIIFAIAMILNNVLQPFANIMLMKHRFDIMLRISTGLLKGFYKWKVSSVHNTNIAKRVFYFTSDLDHVANLLAFQISWITMYFTTAVFLIILLSLNSLTILGFVLFISIIYIIILRYFGLKEKAVNMEVQKSKSSLDLFVEESISATREVISNDWSRFELNIFKSRFNDYYNKVYNVALLMNRKMYISEPLRWYSSIAILCYGGYLVLLDEIKVGLFVVIFQFATRLLETIQRLFFLLSESWGKMASVERLKALTDVTTMEGTGGAKVLDGPIRTIRFEDVSFRYADSLPWVLNNITLDINARSKVAIVGASGGGKSTISHLLNCFYEPEIGRILVNGTPLKEIRSKTWKEKITVVFQDPYLFPDTIKNNLLMGRENITEEQMNEACKLAYIYEDIIAMPNQYETIIGERGVQLSGGKGNDWH